MILPTAHRLSVAPMMDWTDRHCRYLFRLISKNVYLYTEMITTGALLHGNAGRFLAFDSAEQPLAIQLGGSDPADLALCAKMAEDWGYQEVNLNVGCPSDRVASGAFGLCLMKSPDLVAQCVSKMKAAVKVPVTVKTRLGVDDHDDDQWLHAFVEKLVDAGVDQLCLHARKGWLKGLSPKENREIPPLQYDRVYRVKAAFPRLSIALNGGVSTVGSAQEHLEHVDSVMMGRAVYHQPMMLSAVENFLSGDTQEISPFEVLERYFPYVERQLQLGFRLNQMGRHVLNLFNGQKGARQFRQHLSLHMHEPCAGVSVLKAAEARLAK